MIGFARIAGGVPSSVSGMTDHLMNNTLAPEESRLAAYYGRGMVQGEGPSIVALAKHVADGTIRYSVAKNTLMSDYIRDGGDLDQLDAARERIGHRLAVLAERFREGLVDAPLAVIRPDIHPIVLAGLGIEPDGLLMKEEINALLSGHRTDGKPVEGKRYVRERSTGADPRTGEVRVSTPIGSYDFCPTPHKSVSVAWGFSAGAEQGAIYNAHIEAAREAVAYIAAEVGQIRLGDGGKAGRQPGHVGWLEFTHHTSRPVKSEEKGGKITFSPDLSVAGDPDLHTHFLIPSAVFGDDGKVGSLDTMAIRGFIFEADAYYQATLGQKLRDAGFDVVLDERTGAARMVAIPEDISRVFSKRTNMGEALARQEAAKRGEDWDSLSPDQQVTRTKNATQTRQQKGMAQKDDVANFAEWRRQAVQAGWDPPRSLMAFGPPAPELAAEARHRMAYEKALEPLAEKLKTKAVLTQWEVRATAAIGLVHAGIQGLKDIDAVTKLMREEGVRQYGQTTPLIWGQEPEGRQVSISTRLHEADEQAFVRLAQAAATDHSAALSPRAIDAAALASGLDFSTDHGKAQLAAIHRLGEGGRFAVGLGAAGVGKTTMLSVLTAAWKADGRDVHGASLAWRQADDLVEAGIDRRNVKAFSVLIDAMTSETDQLRLTPRSVVAVDEWGLLGTRQGLELLRLQARDGFQIVAMADDKQLASIEAGAIVDLSRRALGPENIPVIDTTVRQQAEREKIIVGLIRDGQPKQALDMKRSDGTAELVRGGRDALVARVAELYVERLKATGVAPTISAPTNVDAHEIGAAVRLERREMGLVGPDLRTITVSNGDQDVRLRLAKGDRVRLFQSTGAVFEAGKGAGIGRNGTILEVLDAADAGLTLKAKNGKAGLVAWSALVNKRTGKTELAYGDAMTIHTAQGSTSQEHIMALPSGSQSITGQAAYVGSTRHRSRTWLLTDETAERRDIASHRPLNDRTPIDTDAIWANVARHMLHTPPNDLVTNMIQRVGAIKRGTILALHTGLHPAEQRHKAGMAMTDIPQRKLHRTVRQIGQRAAVAVQETLEKIRSVRLERKLEPRQARRRGMRM